MERVPDGKLSKQDIGTVGLSVKLHPRQREQGLGPLSLGRAEIDDAHQQSAGDGRMRVFETFCQGHPSRSGDAIGLADLRETPEEGGPFGLWLKTKERHNRVGLAFGFAKIVASGGEIAEGTDVVRMAAKVRTGGGLRGGRPTRVHAIQNLMTDPGLAKVRRAEGGGEERSHRETPKVSPVGRPFAQIPQMNEGAHDLNQRPERDDRQDRRGAVGRHGHPKAAITDAEVGGTARHRAACPNERSGSCGVTHDDPVQPDSRQHRREIDQPEPEGARRQLHSRADRGEKDEIAKKMEEVGVKEGPRKDAHEGRTIGSEPDVAHKPGRSDDREGCGKVRPDQDEGQDRGFGGHASAKTSSSMSTFT